VDIKTIVAPTDFSPSGEAAVQFATSLARGLGASLVLVYAADAAVSYGLDTIHPVLIEPDFAALEELLAGAGPGDGSVPCRRRVVEGDPADVILRVADEEKADLIVMGTHGRTGLTRLLMGSVAESVLRRADCPVLTYRNPAATPAAQTSGTPAS